MATASNTQKGIQAQQTNAQTYTKRKSKNSKLNEGTDAYGKIADGISLGSEAIGVGMKYANEIKDLKEMDVDELNPRQEYNPYYKPPTYEEMETPDSISEGAGNRSFMDNAPGTISTAAKIGGKIAPGVGHLVGGIIGLGTSIGLAAYTGKIAEKKRMKFERNQVARLRDYRQANQQYYDVLGTQSRARSQAKSFEKRGQNVVPYHNANIYGYV